MIAQDYIDKLQALLDDFNASCLMHGREYYDTDIYVDNLTIVFDKIVDDDGILINCDQVINISEDCKNYFSDGIKLSIL